MLIAVIPFISFRNEEERKLRDGKKNLVKSERDYLYGILITIDKRTVKRDESW